jgi:N-dimethylarginine dimethylaminohydrolase
MIAAQHEIVVSELKALPFPRAVLTCPPQCFDVIDVKNPFMVDQQGKVDCALARRQWSDVMAAFDRACIEVKTIAPIEGCEDMVFCANPVFSGLDQNLQRVCVPGHMRYPSRRAEVAAHVDWCRANGYRVVELQCPDSFEGSGDALWHPGRHLIWGGYGPRTGKKVYDQIAEIFGAPVLTLELKTDVFYHLDTCFCPIDSETALVYPPALTDRGMELVHDVFPRVIHVDAHEATNLMACNAAPFFGKYVVIQAGSVKVNQALRDLGFEVIEVETSEFMKSGGSVFCMKMYLF